MTDELPNWPDWSDLLLGSYGPSLGERVVKTTKSFLRDISDSYLAFFYRSTLLLCCNCSLPELLIGRGEKTGIPKTADYLTPPWSFPMIIVRRIKDIKRNRNSIMTYNTM